MACRVVRIAAEEVSFANGLDGFALHPKSIRPAVAAGTTGDLKYFFDDNPVGVQAVGILGPDRAAILDYMRLKTTSRILLGTTLSAPEFTIHYEWQTFHPSRPSVEIYSASGATAGLFRKKITKIMISGLGSVLASAASSIAGAKEKAQKGRAKVTQLAIKYGGMKDSTAETGLVMHYLPMKASADTGAKSISFTELVALIETVASPTSALPPPPLPLPPITASPPPAPAGASPAPTGIRFIT